MKAALAFCAFFWSGMAIIYGIKFLITSNQETFLFALMFLTLSEVFNIERILHK